MVESIIVNDVNAKKCMRGLYMDEEIKLNQELYNAVTAFYFNLESVEDLLKQGANPLGSLDDSKDTCVFTEMLCDASDHMSSQGVLDYEIARDRLVNTVRLFLDYGMLEKLYVDSEDNSKYLPLWEMQFCCCRDAAISLKMILDAGYRGKSLEDFIEHLLVDARHVDCFDINDEEYAYHIEWGSRMIMLIASYSDFMESSEYTQSCIEVENNDIAVIKKFRNFDAYSYTFVMNEDMCDENPILATLYISDKSEEIWSFNI